MIRRVRRDEEKDLRRRLFAVDPDLAFHRQVKDYFLADSDLFGILTWQDLRTLCFFSSFSGKTYVHLLAGDVEGDAALLAHVGKPCEAFVSEGRPEPPTHDGWRLDLQVTPGMVVDHPSYSGVFARVAPRFAGKVYSRD